MVFSESDQRGFTGSTNRMKTIRLTPDARLFSAARTDFHCGLSHWMTIKREFIGPMESKVSRAAGRSMQRESGDHACNVASHCYIGRFTAVKAALASVAQWQSTGFVNRTLWVRLPPLALTATVAGDLGCVPRSRLTRRQDGGRPSKAWRSNIVDREITQAANGARL